MVTIPRKVNTNRLVNRTRLVNPQLQHTSQSSLGIGFNGTSDAGIDYFSDTVCTDFTDMCDISSVSLSSSLSSSTFYHQICDNSSATEDESWFNYALHETSIENQLHNCHDANFNWCFVHSRNKDIQSSTIWVH